MLPSAPCKMITCPEVHVSKLMIFFFKICAEVLVPKLTRAVFRLLGLQTFELKVSRHLFSADFGIPLLKRDNRLNVTTKIRMSTISSQT